MDHDRLFKELITTFFAEFVDLFMPAMAEYLVRDSIEFLDKEIFTDVTSGEKHEADIVTRARFHDGEACFLIHVENQSTPDAGFPKRMFRYFARLHEKHDIPVYPVVIFSYDAPARPEPDHYSIRFPDRRILDFSYQVIQLNRLNWRDYVRQQNPVASALMAKMRIASQDRPRVKMECLRLLATLRLNPAKMQLISGFVDSYLRLNAQEEERFHTEIDSIAPQEREEMMEIVTSWMEEGIAKGIVRGRAEGKAEGKAEGRAEGERNLVLRQLKRQIGEWSEDTGNALNALSATQIGALADALLDFRSPEDLTNWLAANA